ncbi:hypothetical protein [Shimazuella kribbensis]|uniref:hypothetical protein n=1 Tax=Shimazuella kribbensis TaxID=139808 RepID=UPI000418FDB4|nr:hypothetical protein [Shimazuella kribbensis]
MNDKRGLIASTGHPTPEEINPVTMIKDGVRKEMDTLYSFSPENPLVWEGLILLLCIAIFGVTKRKYGPKTPCDKVNLLTVLWKNACLLWALRKL